MDQAKEAVRQTLGQVKAFLAQEAPTRLSEADTKANFIEPIIAALGWTGIGVVTREYYVKNSQEFIDYVMAGPSGRLLAIEAKPLRADLTDKYAAQLIQYCAVEGIEWAALTNGRELQFFNTFLKPDLAAKRVLSMDLLAFNSDEEFDALFAQLWQLSHQSMTTPTGVRSWLNQRRLDAALRTILLNPGSPTLRQLRKVLAEVEVTASTQEQVQWFRSHLVAPITALPVPARKAIGVAPPSGSADSGHRHVQGDGGDSLESGASFDARQSGTFAGSHRALLPLFEALRHRTNDQADDTTWRALKYYVAAESAGHTFLAVKARAGYLLLGLTLPPEERDTRLTDNVGDFNWARMTKVARVADDAAIDNGLLALIGAAREHATSGGRHTRHFGVRLRDLLDAGLLQPGAQLVLVARGRSEVARATLSDAGEIVWEGRAFRSPSDDAFAPLLHVTKFNGWEYWHAELPSGRVSLANVRSGLLGPGTGDLKSAGGTVY